VHVGARGGTVVGRLSAVANVGREDAARRRRGERIIAEEGAWAVQTRALAGSQVVLEGEEVVQWNQKLVVSAALT
jgi:hypothetical protein